MTFSPDPNRVKIIFLFFIELHDIMGWRDNFTEICELGEGSFGKVYKVQWFFWYYAVKEIKRIDQSAQNEIEILKKISHPNIVKYVEHFLNRNSQGQVTEMSIVMEYADLGTLTIYREKLNNAMERQFTTETAIWKLLYEISDALAYLHQSGKRIMHRDLKPDNILCFNYISNSPTFKLADFGIAKLLTQDAQNRYYTDTRAGTYIYMAPEVLIGEEYTFSADMWSVGAIASFWYNSEHLFPSIMKVRDWKGGRSTLSSNFQLDLRNLVASLLHPNKRQRPSAKDVKIMSKSKLPEQKLCTIL